MRRKKENRKIDRKNVFRREVESLNKFLPKYTYKSFDELFEIKEVKVPVSKNQYSKRAKANLVDPVLCGDLVDIDEAEDSDEDGRVLDFNFNEAGIGSVENPAGAPGYEDPAGAAGDEDPDRAAGDEDPSGAAGDEDPTGAAGDHDETMEDQDQFGSFSQAVESGNNKQKKKYRHEKTERVIKLREFEVQLEIQDFQQLNFVKKDLKSLKLLLNLAAVDIHLSRVMKDKISEWEMETDEIDLTSDVQEDDYVESDTEKAAEVEDKDKALEPEDTEMKVKNGKVKKKYKKLIKQILEENGRKMKIKKLKKEVVARSVEFDSEVDPDVRGVKFENYCHKVKNVVIEGKYVIIVES